MTELYVDLELSCLYNNLTPSCMSSSFLPTFPPGYLIKLECLLLFVFVYLIELFKKKLEQSF